MSRPSPHTTPDISRLFLAQAEDNLAQMEEGMVLLESSPEDLEVLNTVFRAVHKLKGDAMMGEYGIVAEAAHNLEDLLERVRSGSIPVDEGLVTILLGYLDYLRHQIERIARGHGVELAKAASVALASTHRESQRSVRVDTEKLNKMMNLAGEIAVARERIRRTLASAGQALPGGVENLLDQTDRLEMDLQELIVNARLVPVGPLFRQQSRTMRDMTKALQKRADLRLEGEDVEVDTLVVESLRDPLLHMVRNALDHGIESPEARRAAGKSEIGTITLRARHMAGQLIVEVSDDGAGLDREKIIARARERGLLSHDGRSLSESAVFDLIFEPGFSTSDKVTEISGRGVGMDIVRRGIQALRGRIGVESRLGAGTTITLRLPLTMAIIRGLGLTVAGHPYIVPLESVIECMDLREDVRQRRAESGVFELRGEPVPYVRMRPLFGIRGDAPDREGVVLVSSARGRAGIVADRIVGQQQVVIKPLDRMFEGLPGVSGSAVTHDGDVALILDVPTLVRHAAERHALGGKERCEAQ